MYVERKYERQGGPTSGTAGGGSSGTFGWSSEESFGAMCTNWEIFAALRIDQSNYGLSDIERFRFLRCFGADIYHIRDSHRFRIRLKMFCSDSPVGYE